MKIRKKSPGRPKGKKDKVSKIDSLRKYFSDFTDNEMLQLDHMLNNGDTYPDIIITIKQQFKKKQDAGPKYLTRRLMAYKKNILEPKLITQIEDVDVYKELLAIKGKVDSMKEFTNLVLSQKRRLERALRLELVSGDVEKFARQEIKLMADILEKLAKLQMETGVLPRAPKIFTGSMETDDEDNISFVITQKFQQALADIEGQFKNVDEEALLIDYEEVDEDGDEDESE